MVVPLIVGAVVSVIGLGTYAYKKFQDSKIEGSKTEQAKIELERQKTLSGLSAEKQVSLSSGSSDDWAYTLRTSAPYILLGLSVVLAFTYAVTKK